MFKRILIYTAIALAIFYWINQQKFSAPFIFNDTQTVKLVWAAKKGDTQKIDQLIKEGADVNYVGKLSFTPLTWMITMVKPSEPSKAGFKHLLINGADASRLIPMSSQTALHFAANLSDSDYLKLIIEHGQDVKINDDRFGRTPLIETIYTSQFENFIMLLDIKAKYDSKGSFERSALDISKGTSSWRFVLELLKRGADYNEGKEEKTPGNPEGLSSIVWTLENARYWPEAATRGHGQDYREQVIEFLRAEGVEVYPWYPEEDSRHNPSPKAILSEEGINEMWDYCYQLNQSKTDTLNLETFNDVNLYTDLSPDNYSLESKSIFGLAMINLKEYKSDSALKIITAEFYGRDQDKYSHYFFNDDNLQCALTIQNIYNSR